MGEDISEINYAFSVGENAASRVGDLLWFGPMRRFQKLFFQTPLLYLFVFGSSLYHDRLWYPLQGNKIVRKWMNESKWGRLFQLYGERTV